MTLQEKKKALLKIIKKEKRFLSEREALILENVRQRVLRNPGAFKPASESEYAILTKEERGRNGSAQRIDYILSKEIEYLLVSRKLPERLLTWLKESKVSLIISPVFGGLVAAITYYLNHKSEIDQLVARVVAGLFKTPGGNSNANIAGLDCVTPEELFAKGDPALLEYLVDLSCNGLEVLPDDDGTLWLASQESSREVC